MISNATLLLTPMCARDCSAMYTGLYTAASGKLM